VKIKLKIVVYFSNSVKFDVSLLSSKPWKLFLIYQANDIEVPNLADA